MSLTSTTSDLATAVLREMNIIDAVETPAAIDATFVTDAYNRKFDELQDRELAYWDRAEIPNSIFLVVRDLVINEVRGAYGEPMAAAEKEGQEIIILRRLRRHTQRRPSGHNVVADYF